MLKILLSICLAMLLSYTCVFAEISQGDLTITGYLKNEFSVGLDTFNEITKFKNILQVSGEYKFSDQWVFFMSTKYWYDAAYDWYAKYDAAQDAMGHIQRADWLRDCYIDYTNGPWFLRLGKQQVSWGQSDGPAILDRVNPVDVSEYWLPDVADMRIPLWMANINYSPKLNSNLQLLIIPDFEQSNAAPPDAPFAFRAYKLFTDFKRRWELPPNSPDKISLGFPFFRNYYGRVNTNIYYPPKQFENSKFGLQWKDRIGDWDYTLNYLYGYDYLARTYFDKTTTQVPFPPIPPFTFTQYYSRRFKLVQMAGGSVNHSFTQEGILKGITLRGEAAMFINEPTYYGNPVTGSTAGVNRWNNFFWLMGLDRNLFTNWLVSFQFAQYIMEDAKPGMIDPTTRKSYHTLNSYTNGPQDQVENIFSLKVATDFLHERLKPEIVWSFTDDNQGRVSPKVTYEVNDNFFVSVGIHYFYGNEYDSNGQYRDASQFYVHLKYAF